MLVICFAVAVLSAQTRQWGFNKDTVYETYPGGLMHDTLIFINRSSDTLKFDTATVSLYYAGFQTGDIHLTLGRDVGSSLDLYSSDDGAPSDGIKQLTVPPNSDQLFDNIILSAQPPSSGNDSLTVLVVFYSSTSSDTFYVKGDALGVPVVVKNPAEPLHFLPTFKAIPRDVNGRAVKYPNSSTILNATKPEWHSR